MRNSFGLKLLHKFFNLPFLALQRDSLLKQLDTNLQEMSLNKLHHFSSMVRFFRFSKRRLDILRKTNNQQTKTNDRGCRNIII